MLIKMGLCLWKLEPVFKTYDLVSFVSPIFPNLVFRYQTPSSKYFLKFENFIGFNLWFWIKWGLVCENWRQGPGLTTWYISIFGPSGPKLVLRSKTPRSRYFLRFGNFIRFNLWLWIKWGPCENWSY